MQALLVNGHPTLASDIDVAFSAISLLLHSHACFPFAEQVPLTKDALIRSIGLITKGSDYTFSQEAASGQDPTIRARSRTARMDFVFSALAHPEPPTGVPTKDDVLDVLCRIRYPHPKSFSMQQRMPITELEPLAERLLPASAALPARETLRISVSSLRPLAQICNAMRTDRGVAAEEVLAGKESLDQKEFKQWAKAVSIMMAQTAIETDRP